MRRIRDNKENESLDNAYKAYDKYSEQKHSRDYVKAFDAELQHNLEEIVKQIADESWMPKGYKKKVIFERKERQLAKAPIEDHVLESATILPYEKAIYDYSTWRAPAVKPSMGTHGLFRFLRNDLYAHTQEEMRYFVPIDAHHYFPLMDHAILKEELARLIKPGKLLTFCYKVVDSYIQGIPLGIKITQLFGQIYLARFDRLAMRFFDIGKDPDKLAYWTQRYVTDRICTATEADYKELCLGPGYLSRKFQNYVEAGVRHYFRFVDNILFIHADKTALHIILELAIMHLSRDWHVTVNRDYNVRQGWEGIRICGNVFFHEKVSTSKRNKKELAKRVSRLRKKGFSEEQIRVKLASRFGFIKHADSINLIKSLGMEKSLGKIIKKRRVRPPFQGMNPDQKVPFSSVVNKCKEMLMGGGVNQPPTKLFLEDYVIQDSKIEKQVVSVSMSDSAGQMQDIPKQVPGKVLAIRFKKIIKTFVTTDFNGEEQETYQFEKTRDEKGQPTTQDAEYYTFTGSKIMIDQAMSDFTREDLPVPTIIQQFRGKDGKEYTKFT